MKNIKERLDRLLKTGFFHIFGSNVLNKILLFLSSITLVRILSKDEYGVFTYAWNIYSIVMIFSGMGIESGTLQIASEHGGESDYSHQIFNYGKRFGITINVLLSIIILLIGLGAPLRIEDSRKLLCLLCLLPIPQLLYQLMTNSLRAQKKNQEYSKLSIINTFLIFVVSVGCAYIFREIGLIIGYYVSYTSSILIGRLLFQKNFKQKYSPITDSDKKSILKISFTSMCNNGLSQLMYLLDVFVLGVVASQESILASYKVATMIPSALTIIPTALIIYVYPYFAEHRNDGRWCLQKYKKIVLYFGMFNLLISFVLFLAAPILIKFFFGNQYTDAIPIFRLLALNYFFSGTFRILSGNLLVTQRKLKFNLLVAIISSFINIIADYFFIQAWGSMGAALATVLVVFVSSGISTTYLIYVLKKNSVESIVSCEEEKR